MTACGRAGIAPDLSLLQRITQAVRATSNINEAAVEALMARIGPMLEAAMQTGALDQNALAKLPTELADQVRATWAAMRAALGRGNTGG
jgi:hypothetical protein